MRLPDWRARLDQYLISVRDEPFAWGRHDCLRFAAGAVAAMTGKDLLPEWATYGSPAEARRALKANGFAGAGAYGDAAASVLEEIHPVRANDGDVALVGGPAFGIVAGPFVLTMGENAVGFVPRSQMRRAFLIP